MPSKYYTRTFTPGYYYHIFNRGVNKSNIFHDDEDYKTFIEILAYYLQNPQALPRSYLDRLLKVPNLDFNPQIIKLCAYSLMPNHFHLLIKQQKPDDRKNGITNLLRRLTITYSMYSKNKYDRTGALLEGKFKNVTVDSDNQLLYLTKYIHNNPRELLKNIALVDYPYSSYKHYVNTHPKPDWLKITEILSFFSKSNPNLSYKTFVEEMKQNIGLLKEVKID